MKKKITFICLLIISNILVGHFLYANDLNEIQRFSEKVEQLRNLASDLNIQNTGVVALLASDTKYKGDALIAFLLLNNGETSSLLHVYILQLNNFDSALENRTGKKALKIPLKTTNYCCWKAISLVHMQLSYSVQEELKAEAIKILSYNSPHILHQVKNTLESLRECLRFFDEYFALTE